MSWLDDVEGSPALNQLAAARAQGPAVQLPQPAEPAPVAPAGAPAAGGGGAVAAGAGGPDLVDWNGGRISRSTLGKYGDFQKNFGSLRMTSSYRSPEQNAAAGGAKKSNHLTGSATDWVGSSKDMYAGASWAKSNGAKEALVHNAGSGMHLHISW